VSLGLPTLLALLAALALDALVGDPERLWRHLPHPVALIGRLVGRLDRRLNDPRLSDRRRRVHGFAAAAVIVGVPAAIAGALQAALLALLPLPLALAAIAVVAAILLAQRSLDEHVAAVAAGLEADGLAGGRRAIALVVGRDPERLDEAGVARAAIETTAESFCDGVVAPAFWFALLGLPGIAAYKAANTADSMIGHRTPRHEAFGCAAARLDDVLNLVPARLAGLLVALAAPVAGGRVARALAVMRRDAPKHASPNAGWPEAAMAGALDLALIGPTVYDGVADDKPWFNAEGRRTAVGADIGRGLAVYRSACGLHAALYAALAAAWALA